MNMRGPFQLLNVNNFSGGMTFFQQRDSECEILENLEIMRDGSMINRLGTEKINNNSLGSNIVVGMDLVNAYLIVAKTGTTFYYANWTAAYPTNFSSFTVPNSPLADPVRMAAHEDATTGAPLYYFVNTNWTGTVKWNGTAGAANYVASSPVGKYIARYAKMLFVSNGTQRIYFSDPGLPDSWPSLNYIDIPAKHGVVTGFASQPGSLIIFTERSVLILRGVPPLRYDLDVLHERIGCDAPNTISQFGSVIYFTFRGAIMQLSTSVELVSDAMRGFPRSATGVDADVRSWGVLTPFYYILSYPTNTAASGAQAPTSGDPFKLWVYDRVRFQAFSRWAYPLTTGLGSLQGVHSVIAGPDNTQAGILVAGGDGNIYRQSFRLMNANYLSDGTLTFTDDADTAGTANIDVTGRWRSRRYDMGSPLIQKVHRRVLVAGQGTVTSLTARRYDVSQTVRSDVLVTNKALPFDTRKPGFSGASGYPRFSEFQIDMSGTDLWVKSVAVEWRPQRLAGGANLA